MIDEKYQKYVGIPYKMRGYDFNGTYCWGLVRLVLYNEFNISIPKITYNLRKELKEGNPDIPNIDFHEIALDMAKEGDIAQMYGMVDGEHTDQHIGIFVDENHILHTENELTMSMIEDVRSLYVKSKLIRIIRIDR